MADMKGLVLKYSLDVTGVNHSRRNAGKSRRVRPINRQRHFQKVQELVREGKKKLLPGRAAV